MEEHSKKITYESLWKAIIRPPRDYYTENDLGPTNFQIHGRTYLRKDFDLVDFHGLILKVSIIEPDNISRPFDIMPCVIYVHANSSSRVEGIYIKNYLLKKNINICAFDFEGSGYSEGEYISLGFHEKYQLKNVIDFIENYPGVGEIGLWGRSMGAATSLIYASMDKRIKAIVVDSPFTDFRRVAKEMCMSQVSIPGFLIEGAISIIGKSVYKKNKMKINEIKPIEAVKKCDIPVIFIHAKDDELVNFQHTLDLYNNYRGISKQIKEVSGGHNGKRPSIIMENIAKFFNKHLQLKYQNNDEDIIKLEENKNSEEKNKISEDIESNVIFNENLPQKKNKTIYEAMGIPNPNLTKEEKENINEKEEKIEEVNQIKEDVNINKIINNNEIIEPKKEEEKIEEKIKENDKIENNIKESNNEDKIPKKNLTFYSTNKNFDSYFEACINNNDDNKTNQENDEKNKEKNIDNYLYNENNILNINMNMPKRKTIYDDLNLRFKTNS